MNSQTKQETIYNRAAQEILTASSEASWLKMLRENAMLQFAELGFPTVANEDWKYTNVTPFVGDEYAILRERQIIAAEKFADAVDETIQARLVFVNGKFAEDLSDVSGLAADGASVMTLETAASHERFGETVKQHLARQIQPDFNGFTAMNTALWQDGAFIFLPKNVQVENPIGLFFLSSGENFAAFPRVLVVAERGAEATVIESYFRTGETKYLTNAVVEISLADNAKLKHYRVQRESHAAFHVAATHADLGRASVYDTTNIILGASLSRHDVGVNLNAEGAECWVDGLYVMGETQHTDTHSIIDHRVPNCTSHQTYKGIMDGKSRAVFNGKIFVREGASGTNGYQSNKNLLLSNDARVDTKPQLEIFNDDVKCSHGATVGQLEDEEVFYLLSRGLSPTLARNLLTYGFAEEIVNKIEIESIKNQLDAAVLNRLDAKF